MNFLFIGDRQYRATKPKNRIDDYHKSSRERDEEIKQIAMDNNVEAILHSGDLWENPLNSDKFINEKMKTWVNFDDVTEIMSKLMLRKKIDKTLEEKIKENQHIPFISIAGNHDLVGGDIHSLPKTTLGQLIKYGIIHYPTKEKPIIFKDGDKTIAITGSSYHFNMDDEDFKKDDYIIEEKLGDIHIHIVHGMLRAKSMGKKIKNTSIDEVVNTKADITLAGHDHNGFGVIHIKDKFFVNTGAIMRTKNQLEEMKRMPSVALIKINNGNIEVEEIFLKTAKKGTEILDRSVIEAEKEKEKNKERYVEEINQLKVAESLEVLNVMKNYGKKLPSEIMDRPYQMVLESIKNRDTIVSENVEIEKLIIKNFQSHKYSEFYFDDKLNVILGRSGKGKSVILKALLWVYENKPLGNSFVKRGEDTTEVTVILKNGLQITRKLRISLNTDNTLDNEYIVKDKDGNEILNGNTKTLEDVQKYLGYNRLELDDLDYSKNFYMQGEGWFFIGNHISSIKRANMLSYLKGASETDNVLQVLNKENKRINRDLGKQKIKLEEKKEKIKSFDYLEDLNKKIEKSFTDIKTIKKELTKYSHLKDVVNKKYELIKEKENEEKTLKETNKIVNIAQDFKRLKADISNTRKDFSLIKNKHLSIEKLEKENEVINKTSNLENISKREYNLKESFIKTKNIYDNIEKKYQIEVEKNKQEELLKETNDLDKVLKDFINNKKNLEEAINLKNIITNKNIALKKLGNANKFLNQTKNISNQLIETRKIKSDTEKIKKICNIVYDKKIKSKKLNNIHILLSSSPNFDKDIERFKKINKELSILENLNNVMKSKNKNKKLLIEENKKIKKSNEEIDSALTRYEKVLNKHHACPICNSKLENKKIKLIIEKKKSKIGGKNE